MGKSECCPHCGGKGYVVFSCGTHWRCLCQPKDMSHRRPDLASISQIYKNGMRVARRSRLAAGPAARDRGGDRP